MSLKKLDEQTTVSGQISPDDVKTLAGMGYKAIICNRPDGESWGQPSHEEMAKVAKEAGIEFHYAPLDNRTMNPTYVAGFADTFKAIDGQVHLYCGSGARSTMFWQLLKNAA